MDEGGVHVVAGDLRDGAHLTMFHDDGVTGHVAEALGVTLDSGVEDLGGIALGHAAGDDSSASVLPFQVDVHLGTGVLVAVGEQTFLDNQLGVLACLGLGVPLGVVHAADLAQIQGHGSTFLQVNDGLGVQDALASAGAFAVVLFGIGHLGVFAHVEGVDAVMLAVIAAAVVDATAGHDVHLSPFADEEVVVDPVSVSSTGMWTLPFLLPAAT